MRAHAVEGINLDLQVDTWPVSINVAMPAGLVVNELMINALKHAFAGRARRKAQPLPLRQAKVVLYWFRF